MNENMKKIIVLGGGTFSPIRNHLSLCAPAFGTTARKLYQLFTESEKSNVTKLVLTKMADPESELKTNEDVASFIDSLLGDESVGTIILNVAFCDFNAVIEHRGFHGERLKTADGNINLELTPSEKVVDAIRKKRPDIFLVGFKTTTNADVEIQFLSALKMMKRSKCNLVLANDTVTRKNMIITPEESRYEAGSREAVLKDLVKMVLDRNDLTYSRTVFNEATNIPMADAPESFQRVMQFLIDNGGYLENNGNGFTPGHFCYKVAGNEFVSSQRKVNHNEVFTRGMTRVNVESEKFIAFGTHKPSVGSRSQWLMMSKYTDYDCVVHTHNPLKVGSLIPLASQREFQCGSLECGLNTLNNLKDFDNGMKAVMLEKHGINLLFKSSMNSELVIGFIRKNVMLGVKTI